VILPTVLLGTYIGPALQSYQITGAGLTGPISAQSLPTDEEDVMGQPPQVNFDGGGGGATPNHTPSDDDSAEVKNEIKDAEGDDSIFERAKALVSRNWTWVFAGAAAVVVGGLYVKRRGA